MGKKANPNEINFNYPIPRSLHKKVRNVSMDFGISVKDVVVNALIMYVDYMNEVKDEEMCDKALHEPHGTEGFEEEL